MEKTLEKRENTHVVKIKHPKTGEYLTEYYLDPRLKANLDKTAKDVLAKKDKDLFIVVDGAEGSGKSTLALQIAKYVDPTLDLSRVVFDADSFRDAIMKAKKNQCIVFDEAFNGLSSRASLSAMNKGLVGLMMQMRQKNLFVVMVLPTFFLLERYAAIWRTKALIHVYESKGRRGYFRVYNNKLKKKLYLIGKKDYSYADKRVRTRFRGRFYGKFSLGDEKIEKKYRDKKMKALELSSENPLTSGQIKYKEQRDILLYLFRKSSDMTYQEIDNYIADYGISMSYQQIAKICAKFGDVEKKKDPMPASQEELPNNQSHSEKKTEENEPRGESRVKIPSKDQEAMKEDEVEVSEELLLRQKMGNPPEPLDNNIISDEEAMKLAEEEMKNDIEEEDDFNEEDTDTTLK